MTTTSIAGGAAGRRRAKNAERVQNEYHITLSLWVGGTELSQSPKVFLKNKLLL